MTAQKYGKIESLMRRFQAHASGIAAVLNALAIMKGAAKMGSYLMVPYLLIVSFLTPVLSNPDVMKIKALNNSPFQGVTVMLRDAYDCKEVTLNDFRITARLLKIHCRKDIWPWIFFNRFVGYKASSESHESVRGQKFAARFEAIKGMDLFNETGALADFLNIWRISLQISKELGSPGIVVDPEAYNNYDSMRVEYLAGQMDKSEGEIRGRLREIGKELADFAGEIYPDATIWFLATGLDRLEKDSPLSLGKFVRSRYQPSFTYIILGMLERSKEKNLRLRFVCGGEEALGYCHESLRSMKEKISKRQASLEPILRNYDNIRLAGTLAPWDKVESKSGYFADNYECRTSEFRTITDFEPVLKTLFSTYDYNWMYAGTDLWNPYDPKTSAAYNKVLDSAIKEVHKK